MTRNSLNKMTRNSLNKNEAWPIFPKYYRGEYPTNEHRKQPEYTLRTMVRKEYNGKWYLIPVLHQNVGQDYLPLFIEEIYRIILFYNLSKADEWIAEGAGTTGSRYPAIYLDEYQGTEEERIKKQMP